MNEAQPQARLGPSQAQKEDTTISKHSDQSNSDPSQTSEDATGYLGTYIASIRFPYPITQAYPYAHLKDFKSEEQLITFLQSFHLNELRSDLANLPDLSLFATPTSLLISDSSNLFNTNQLYSSRCKKSMKSSFSTDLIPSTPHQSPASFSVLHCQKHQKQARLDLLKSANSFTS